MKYDVISPDGFPISGEVYKTKKEALEMAKDWVKRYERQGYYNSVNFGRIPIPEILDYCKIIKISSFALKLKKLKYS